mgnify:FL=1
MTAEILGNVTGVEFDIDGIINFITRILKKQFSFYVNSNPKFIAEEVYEKAIQCECSKEEIDKVKYVLITPEAFKKAINDIRDQYDISGSKITDKQIKEILNRDLDLLKDTVTTIKTKNGKSKRFYYLKNQGV